MPPCQLAYRSLIAPIFVTVPMYAEGRTGMDSYFNELSLSSNFSC